MMEMFAEMLSIEWVLFILLLLAGFYMAWAIGANDVANAMGTSVGSGALTLRQAVILAAIMEFSGAFFFGSHVSETMQKGIVDPQSFISSPQTLVFGMFASLLSTGAWLQIASYFGFPVSTTHSIVGSLLGFGALIGGIDAIKWETVGLIVSSWVISPLAGGILGYLLFLLLRNRIFYTHHPIQATKQLTPLLVFCVATIFSLILILDSLEKIAFPITDLQATALCFLIGVISALFGYLYVRKIKVDKHVKFRPHYGPEISVSLKKATKHLCKVEAAAIGEISSHATHLIEEISRLSDSLQQKIEEEVSPSEYKTVEKIFGYLQILSASLMAFAHGANDVANAIGPLAAAIGVLTTGVVTMRAEIPTWILTLGGAGIIVGLATWGWRVIETIGKKITELTPTRGFVAEFAAATTILIASRLGMPISTTHTLVGAVLGVGFARGIEALNLGLTRDIVVSWIVTVPTGAALSVFFFFIIQHIFG